MNPLLIVLPFHNGDLTQAKNLLQWIYDIELLSCPAKGVQRNIPLLLAADSKVPMEDCRTVGALARKTFKRVDSLVVTVEQTDWRAPNSMFSAIASYVEGAYKFPFLWMEPDCTPLRAGWAEMLAAEYAQCPKRFMGPLIECKDPELPALHMTGCSIYPPDAFDILKDHCNGSAKFAWDVDSAATVVKQGRASDTKLIQHFYGTKDLAPTFVSQKVQGEEYPTNAMEVSFIKEEAVLFHRVKDGSLINILRKFKTEDAAASGSQETTPENTQKPTTVRR